MKILKTIVYRFQNSLGFRQMLSVNIGQLSSAQKVVREYLCVLQCIPVLAWLMRGKWCIRPAQPHSRLSHQLSTSRGTHLIPPPFPQSQRRLKSFLGKERIHKVLICSWENILTSFVQTLERLNKKILKLKLKTWRVLLWLRLSVVNVNGPLITLTMTLHY